MATSTQDWIEELKGISVLELAERIKALEEEFGVSAAAVAAPAAAAPAGGGDDAAAEDEGPSTGRRGPHRSRRQEDPGDQGRPRRHRPRPPRGQGARRRGAQARQGGHREATRPTSSRQRTRGGRARAVEVEVAVDTPGGCCGGAHSVCLPRARGGLAPPLGPARAPVRERVRFSSEVSRDHPGVSLSAP